MNKILNGFHLYSGMESGFIPISKRVGIKLFCKKIDRDDSFNVQQKALRYGIAPKVGQKLCLHLPCAYKALIHKSKLHGYVTERADKVGKTKVTKDFLKKIRDAKISTWDMHSLNVGKIGKRTVCVDFGRTTAGTLCK